MPDQRTMTGKARGGLRSIWRRGKSAGGASHFSTALLRFRGLLERTGDRAMKATILLLLALAGAAAAHAAERWGVFEIELAGPAAGNPYLDVRWSATFAQDGRRITVPGFYDGDGAYKVRFSPPTRGLVALRDAEQPAGAGRQDRLVHRRAAVGEQSRAGPGLPDVLPALRRRLALSPVRHHLLRLGASAPRASGADAQDARRLAVQQDPLLRLPQELLHRQQERAGALRLPEGSRRQVRLQPAGPRVLAAVRAAHPRPPEAGHRGGHHPLAPLRPLGLLGDERRRGRPLPAVLHRPALGVSQRLVVAGQRVRLHDRSSGPAATAATSSGRTGTGSSRSSRRRTRTSGCAASTTAASGTTTRRTGSRTPASRPRT